MSKRSKKQKKAKKGKPYLRKNERLRLASRTEHSVVMDAITGHKGIA